METRICLGAIVGVHGIRGDVKIKSFTHIDKGIGSYGLLSNKSGDKQFSLKVIGYSKELLRAKIKGVDDRNTAETLIGTELWCERTCLPPLGENEFYHADLIGLDVRFEHEKVGKVLGLYNFGAGDILEIELNGQNEMIPFTKEYVPEIEIEKGYIIIAKLGLEFEEESEDEN